jgi:hypothetical protein
MKHECHSEDAFLAAAKLQRISDSDANDIFVAGYPKSGNTWMQYLLAGLIFRIDVSLVPDSVVQSLVPDVHSTPFYKRHMTPTFFKTHNLPLPEYRRVIYVVRDGRDAMVSYFHFLAALGYAPDFLKLVTTGEGLFPCRWHEHVEAWIGNPHRAQMLMISYEALKNDTVGELHRICNFVGLEREESLFERVAQNSSFTSMREREKKLGWENAAWPKDKAFLRRGTVGSFRDEMSEPILEAFVKSSEQTLKRLGYL